MCSRRDNLLANVLLPAPVVPITQMRWIEDGRGSMDRSKSIRLNFARVIVKTQSVQKDREDLMDYRIRKAGTPSISWIELWVHKKHTIAGLIIHACTRPFSHNKK